MRKQEKEYVFFWLSTNANRAFSHELEVSALEQYKRQQQQSAARAETPQKDAPTISVPVHDKENSFAVTPGKAVAAVADGVLTPKRSAFDSKPAAQPLSTRPTSLV